MEGIISFLTPHDDSRMFLWLILVVFLVGAGLGVFKFFAFYLNLTEFVDAYKNNKHGVAEEDPETYLTRATGIESTSRILSPFPSVLVTVGILGTFIGIGMAIAEAIPALEQDGDVKVVQDALKALLSAVKFKFQTSAYGILASLIFVGFESILIGVLHQKVESLARTLGEHRVSIAAQLADDLANGIERGFRSMGESLKEGLTLLTTSTMAMKAEASSLGGGVEQLSASVNLFGEQIQSSTAALSESSGKLGKLGEDIDASLIRVSSTLESSGQQQNEQTKKALKKMTNTMGDALEKMQASLTESLEASRASQEQSMAHLLAGQQRAAADLQDTMSASLTSMEHSISKFSENQEKGLDELKGYQNEASAALESLAKTLKKFERQSERMINIADKLRGAGDIPNPPPPRRTTSRPRANGTTNPSPDFL